ncbi:MULTISPECIES: NAD(P)/FAD-dependent oxidoreductase [unclassified Halomonas]|uniref:NAD(P)/FAD-dependent oxidoreductase n=1 Tax=unclassified Halomonas TaxID=2609666 RepID=UPI001CF0E991|nr:MULTISPECIES: FAD-dependent oxidoreductase [unclassified Halomonas]MCA8863829.1 FAD-binding oxidoreductase [Halomonas sp. SBBP1]UZH11071.1 FAD-binding oxidoreductase [Halomonas sp. BDJS001]
MDLKSGYPFWAVKNGLLKTFPQLTRDHQCEVVVIGGGITGALIADELSKHGHHVVVLERRDVGWGSSAASTALLQYEIDTHMTALAERYGEADAVRAYRACAEAIGELESLAAGLGNVDFERQQSLYYASSEEDVAPLKEELALRQAHGFEAEWMEREAILAEYGFVAPGAILTQLAASVDPYRMAYQLFSRVVERGGEVYDRTQMETMVPDAEGVTLTLANGARLRCQNVVMAAGYESQSWLPEKVAINRSSYALITDPLPPEALGKLRHTMVWESARPYLYMRTTRDGRLLVGGDDDDEDIPKRRDARVEEKAEGLAAKIEALWPKLDINPTFSWGGTFAETDDGLPFFGPHEVLGSRIHFAMAYGGNGISYSMIGAKLLRALIEGREHPLAELFSFRRLAKMT